MDKETIKRILLDHGFTIKQGEADLKPYVYSAASAIYEAALQAAQPKWHPPETVQGEPVAWATRLYNTAYHAGHHDTVDGGYTHVYPQDMDSYHEDIVQEWLADNPQPAVQGEPVAWSGWGCQHPGKMPRLYGERRIAELNCDWENGDQLLHFTAAPQPAEQQPAPDVAQLVEALELIAESCDVGRHDGLPEEGPAHFAIESWLIARDALAAYRKGAKP